MINPSSNGYVGYADSFSTLLSTWVFASTMLVTGLFAIWEYLPGAGKIISDGVPSSNTMNINHCAYGVKVLPTINGGGSYPMIRAMTENMALNCAIC